MSDETTNARTDETTDPVSRLKSIKHPFLIYNLARLGLLLLCAALLYMAGLRDVILVIWAFLLSSVISIFLLSRFRDAMGIQMGGYFSNMNRKIDARTQHEDAMIDEHERQQAEAETSSDLSVDVDPDDKPKKRKQLRAEQAAAEAEAVGIEETIDITDTSASKAGRQD